MRRVWFLYEWLLGKSLNIPNAKTGTYADIVDRKLQWAVKGRHIHPASRAKQSARNGHLLPDGSENRRAESFR